MTSLFLNGVIEALNVFDGAFPTLQTGETVLSLRWIEAIPSMKADWKMMQ